MAKRKHKPAPNVEVPKVDPNVPTFDYLAGKNLDDWYDLEQVVQDLTHDIEMGYFLTWEAVVRQEQRLQLSTAQMAALDELSIFSDYSPNDRILYINDMARPNMAWYEIVQKVVPKLVVKQFKTYEKNNSIVFEGWPELANTLVTYGKDLSVPKGTRSSLEVVPANIQHQLWLQYCLDMLNELGQTEELTLENEEQLYRIEGLIDRLKECETSVKFLNLTLEDLLARVSIPAKDEQILVAQMLQMLNMPSPKEYLVKFL
jgi:hypothetical protein